MSSDFTNRLRGMHGPAIEQAYRNLAADLIDSLSAEAAERRKEPAPVRCCRGCPDCLGIGSREQLKWQIDRIAELEAALAARDAAIWTKPPYAKAEGRIEELEAALRALQEVLVWGEDHEAWTKGRDLIDRALGDNK